MPVHRNVSAGETVRLLSPPSTVLTGVFSDPQRVFEPGSLRVVDGGRALEGRVGNSTGSRQSNISDTPEHHVRSCAMKA